MRRIYGDFLKKKLGAGEVHLYILKPDGSSLTGLGPIEAAQPNVLKRLLTDVIGQFGHWARRTGGEAAAAIRPAEIGRRRPCLAPGVTQRARW